MNEVIVVGVDGSETAVKAAERAARLANALQAELLVVSAYGQVETERVSAEGRKFSLDHEARALEAAESTITSLRAAYPELTMTPVAAEGKPGEALVDVATDRSATMIVVGNKRVQSIARVLGTVASDVAHKAPCDVHIAHTHS